MGTTDPAQLFSQIFLNRSVPAQPFDGLFAGTVAANATSGQADVTLDGFDTKNVATYTCVFEPRFGSGSSAETPPVGTKCLVAFTTPITYVAGTPGVGVGAKPWIVAFLGWPT